MRQIVTTRNGDVRVLQLREAPDPTPGEGQVVIQVRAVGLNFADIMARQGLYPDAPKKPCVLGYEVAGTIVVTGPNVSPELVGRSVIALTDFGGQSEKVCVSFKYVFFLPDSLTFEQAAAIPVSYLTAYVLIVVMGGLQRGQSILIHNAGGGAGLAALDIAEHIGGITFGTASKAKHEFLLSRGLDHAIDYREQDWFPVLMQLTNGKGVDLIIDSLGPESWKKSYKALRKTGRLGMFGVSSISENGMGGKLKGLRLILFGPKFSALNLLNSNKAVFGVNLEHTWEEIEKISERMNIILKGVKEGWVRPRVDRTFKFSEIAEAHNYLESRKNIGKVVLVP